MYSFSFIGMLLGKRFDEIKAFIFNLNHHKSLLTHILWVNHYLLS